MAEADEEVAAELLGAPVALDDPVADVELEEVPVVAALKESVPVAVLELEDVPVPEEELVPVGVLPDERVGDSEAETEDDAVDDRVMRDEKPRPW